MNDGITMRDRVVAVHTEHPDWTAKQIAAELGVERHHVYNNARAAGITLASAPAMPIRLQLPARVEQAQQEEEPAAPAAHSRDAVDITVFATKPHEMAAAQADMVEWSRARVAEAKADMADAQEGLRIAVENAWQTQVLERVVNRAAKMVQFYEKIHLALAAGYYIVPPFPIDIFTIRTDRRRPKEKRSASHWERHAQEARILPAGDGRYVSRDPSIHQTTTPAIGDAKAYTEYFAKEFRDVAFPFALAKPQIMEATAAAMALKVFDQLGMLPAVAKSDPIICGQILKPAQQRYRITAVTFFVAWWLDTRTL